MRENLRTTHYADGTPIPAGGDATSDTDPYYYINISLDAITYGYLYNCPAAMASCPTGWHLPSDVEWNTMEATVSGSDWQASYETATEWRGSHAGKLAGGDGWTSSTTSGASGDYSNADRNVSGFSAVPAGYCYGTSFYHASSYANFWSSSENGANRTWYRHQGYNNVGVNRSDNRRYYGFSVRCLRD